MNISTFLLAIIGIAFLFQMVSAGFTEAFIFAPTLAIQEPWRFVSSMFLHGGFMHIFFNAYALFLFGSIVERRMSSAQYLLLFFASGLIGGLAYYATYLLGIIPPIPALGASGAIYGILGAAAVMFPEMRIFVWFFPMKMKHAAIFWVVLEFFGSFNIASGIASAAHLGGLIFGLAFAWFLNQKHQEHYMPPESWE
jgi:membrane associated rhomboid family serine protease